jgi:putative membrane protein
MMFGMLFFWIAVVALVAFAARSGRADATGDGFRARSPREILEERFARGEISEEEFEGRKQVLARHAS